MQPNLLVEQIELKWLALDWTKETCSWIVTSCVGCCCITKDRIFGSSRDPALGCLDLLDKVLAYRVLCSPVSNRDAAAVSTDDTDKFSSIKFYAMKWSSSIKCRREFAIGSMNNATLLPFLDLEYSITILNRSDFTLLNTWYMHRLLCARLWKQQCPTWVLVIPIGGGWKSNVGGTISYCLLKMPSFVVTHNCCCAGLWCYFLLWHIAHCCCTAVSSFCWLQIIALITLGECELAAVHNVAPLVSSHPALHSCCLVACCCCCWVGEHYGACCVSLFARSGCCTAWHQDAVKLRTNAHNVLITNQLNHTNWWPTPWMN